MFEPDNRPVESLGGGAGSGAGFCPVGSGLGVPLQCLSLFPSPIAVAPHFADLRQLGDAQTTEDLDCAFMPVLSKSFGLTSRIGAPSTDVDVSDVVQGQLQPRGCVQ